MNSGQARLAETITEIIGQDKLAEYFGLERLIEMIYHLKAEVAELDIEQRTRLLRALMGGLSEQELKDLLNRPTAQLAEVEAKPEASNK